MVLPAFLLPCVRPIASGRASSFTEHDRCRRLLRRPRAAVYRASRAPRTRSVPRACVTTLKDSEKARPHPLSAALLPALVLATSALALYRPALFLWFRPSFSTPCLAMIMLSMGLTLRPADFSRVASQPARLLLASCAQYGIMPLLAAVIARTLALPAPIALGVVLTGCCPGGAASNLVCLFAGADVAYSVLLTLISTALSVALTPLLVHLLAGAWMHINALALLVSVAQVAILPLFIGGALQAAAPGFVGAIEPVLPFVSLTLVALIVGSVMSVSAPVLIASAPSIVLALALLHVLGALLGYIAGAAARLPFRKRRTLAIEVCMQNSTLSSSLATAHFTDPLVAVPGAISATLHLVLGSVLAAVWRIGDMVRARRKEALGEAGNRR